MSHHLRHKGPAPRTGMFPNRLILGDQVALRPVFTTLHEHVEEVVPSIQVSGWTCT